MFDFLKARPTEEISVDELHTLLKEPRGRSFIDVRENDEWDEAHIDGFVHMPLNEIEEKIAQFDPSQTYYMLCAGGNRSARACHTLRNSGIRAINVRGGIRAWIAQQLPTSSTKSI